MGTGTNEGCIHIIDFGLANQYFDPGFGRHIPLVQQKSAIIGTMRYLSVHAHQGFEHTRRDDLESLAYILIYFLCGSLPWQNIKAKSRKRQSESILKLKLTTPIEVLCKGQPDTFITFLKYTRSLTFDARPDYEYLRAIFRQTFDFAGYRDDCIFDWSTKYQSPTSSLSSNFSSSTSSS